MTIEKVSWPEPPWLVADIGGTHARFGLARDNGKTIDAIASLRCADFVGPQEALDAYLDRAGVKCPRVAAFAVATPVAGDAIHLTNSRWPSRARRCSAHWDSSACW